MERKVEVKARIQNLRATKLAIRDLTQTEPQVMQEEDTFYRVPEGTSREIHGSPTCTA